MTEEKQIAVINQEKCKFLPCGHSLMCLSVLSGGLCMTEYQCFDICKSGSINPDGRSPFTHDGVHLEIRDVYCYGCGDCVEACPEDAISLEPRA